MLTVQWKGALWSKLKKDCILVFLPHALQKQSMTVSGSSFFWSGRLAFVLLVSKMWGVPLPLKTDSGGLGEGGGLQDHMECCMWEGGGTSATGGGYAESLTFTSDRTLPLDTEPSSLGQANASSSSQISLY